jgi:hypothetical protein
LRGLLVGNADGYFSLLGLSKQDSLGKKDPVDLFLGEARSRAPTT